jgi:F0F1-type ATP synthase alpha subunit
VPVEDVRVYEAEMHQFFQTRRGQLLAALAEKKAIDDQIKADLNQALKEFTDGFVSRKKAPAA